MIVKPIFTKHVEEVITLREAVIDDSTCVEKTFITNFRTKNSTDRAPATAVCAIKRYIVSNLLIIFAQICVKPILNSSNQTSKYMP